MINKIVLTVITVTLLGGNAVQAREYPWCAYYGMFGGAVNCGFSTQSQCRAAISGVGGYCQIKPRYQRTSPRTRRLPRN